MRVIRFCAVGIKDFVNNKTVNYVDFIWLEPIKISNLLVQKSNDGRVFEDYILFNVYIYLFFGVLLLLICIYAIGWLCTSVGHCFKAKTAEELIIPVISMLSWICAWSILNYAHHVFNLDVKAFLMKTLNSALITEVFSIMVTVMIIYQVKMLIEKCILSSNNVGQFFVSRIWGE